MLRIITTAIIAILIATSASVWALSIQEPSEATEQPILPKVDETPQKAEKAVTKPEKASDAKIKVVDPQGCEPEQYWDKNPPHECIDKPQEQVVSVARSEATPVTSPDCYYELLSQYDWDVATMQRIMRAESGCNPTNHNWSDNHGSCLGSYGLLQIGCVHGYSVEYLSSAANNIEAAYKIWLSQGYTAWTTY